MVKQKAKIFLLFIIFCVLAVSGCRIDLLGVFASSDLDERLKERDVFNYLIDSGKGRDWTSLGLAMDFRFLVITDTHIEDGEAWGLEKLADVIAANNSIAANPQIEFAVFLGDITQFGAGKDIDKFIEIADLLGVPCYPVIGNHDVYFRNWTVWKEKIGSTSYRINGGSATLFVLDSANSFFGKDQLDWLERELRTANGKVFVFTHSPLFVKGPADMQQITDTKERARVISILRNKCEIMFMGHAHKQFSNEAGNVKYIAFEDFKSTQTYCMVSVESGNVTYSFGNL